VPTAEQDALYTGADIEFFVEGWAPREIVSSRSWPPAEQQAAAAAAVSRGVASGSGADKNLWTRKHIIIRAKQDWYRNQISNQAILL
jgi:hypothetical protein